MLTADRLRKTPTGRMSGPPQPMITLNSGVNMPLMAFGTLMETIQSDEQKTVSVIEDAVDVGYRHLDTAQVYNTESMVGQALRNKMAQGTINRADVFITTKLWRNCHKKEDVVPSLKRSLEKLGLLYVDLFVMHWPTAFESGREMFPKDEHGKFKYAAIDYLETWKGMEECVTRGLTKAIGVSNFNREQLQRILDNSNIRPACNQIESHPYLTNTKMVEFCKSNNIAVMAYSPLFGFNQSYRNEQNWPTIYTDKIIRDIADKHKATPAQVVLRYQLQRGVGVTPKSSKRSRMEENIASLLMNLTEEEMGHIEGCNKNFRLNAELPDHPYYPFNVDF